MEIGGSISAAELILIADFLDNVRQVRAYGKEEREEDGDLLTEMFDALMPNTTLAEETHRCILSKMKLRMRQAVTLSP